MAQINLSLGFERTPKYYGTQQQKQNKQHINKNNNKQAVPHSKVQYTTVQCHTCSSIDSNKRMTKTCRNKKDENTLPGFKVRPYMTHFDVLRIMTSVTRYGKIAGQWVCCIVSVVHNNVLCCFFVLLACDFCTTTAYGGRLLLLCLPQAGLKTKPTTTRVIKHAQ